MTAGGGFTNPSSISTNGRNVGCGPGYHHPPHGSGSADVDKKKGRLEAPFCVVDVPADTSAGTRFKFELMGLLHELPGFSARD